MRLLPLTLFVTLGFGLPVLPALANDLLPGDLVVEDLTIDEGTQQPELETGVTRDQTVGPRGTLFDQARTELSDDWYTIYRVTERIVRANELNERPWRIRVLPRYQINAFATESNLIGIYSGMIDQFAGDTSALACVIGHEIAHHTQRHIPLQAASMAQAKEQVEAQIIAEVTEEVQRTQGEVAAGQVIGRMIGGTMGSMVRSAANQSRRGLSDRVQGIVNERLAEFQEEQLALSRQQELEADEWGYRYATRAGFDPDGCTRVLAMLGNLPGAEFDSTHPSVPARQDALRGLMQQYPQEVLKPQGDINTRLIPPLDYAMSSDGQSLRINSRFGSADDDFDRLFGQ